MKNEFIIDGDTAVILAKHKGEYKTILVDANRLGKLMELGVSIHVSNNGKGRTQARYKKNGKYFCLSNLLFEGDTRIVSKNGDSLDLRSSNVRLEGMTQNTWSEEGDTLYLTLIKGKTVKQFKFDLEDEAMLKNLGRLYLNSNYINANDLSFTENGKSKAVKKLFFSNSNIKQFHFIDGDDTNFRKENIGLKKRS